MTCYHPIDCVGVVDGKTQRLAIRFSGDGEKMQVPCGQCIGCRLDYSLHWAVRCLHEASLHERNSFITLTYDDDHLPTDGSLVKHHFQDFMKRLRRRNSHHDEFGNFWRLPIRFFHCGEYGDDFDRPHYHALLFGFDFPDRKLWRNRYGVPTFTSEYLESVWKYGFSTVGDVTYESAAYVARYCVKKMTGDKAFWHYISNDGVMLQPEYTLMSRRPGIGSAWYGEFGSDVFPSDEVVVAGKVRKPPRYYQKKYQLADPEGYEKLLAKRMEFFGAHEADCSPERLAVREEVAKAGLKFKSRGYEDDL